MNFFFLLFSWLAAYHIFQSSEGRIEWQYVKSLFNLQEELGFRFANKLSKRHIHFFNNKMKVKLATQVFSSSVADAIDFLRDSGVPEFKDSEATVHFIRQIDCLFDFLNSRNPFGKGFKRPIFPSHVSYFQHKIEVWIKYLTSLRTLNDIPLLCTRRNCFINGFIMSLNSVLSAAIDLLATPFYKYVLTYKFSQDHLELFFGIIRLRLGCNNNPNALQLKYILRKLLLKHSIKLSSETSETNCTVFDATGAGSLFQISGRSFRRRKSCVNIDVQIEDECDDIGDLPEFDENSLLKDNIMFYISGYIVFKLLPFIKCKGCASGLLGSDEHFYSRGVHSFTAFKNRGGLSIPSMSVFRIVKEAERFIQFYSKDLQTLRGQKILYHVRRKLLCNDSALFPRLDCDEYDLDTNPKIVLLNLICERYLKIRLYSIEMKINDRISRRNKSLKTTLFEEGKNRS